MAVTLGQIVVRFRLWDSSISVFLEARAFIWYHIYVNIYLI